MENIFLKNANSCTDYQSRFSELMDKTISNETAIQTKKHLDSCPDCSKEWELLQALSNKIRLEGKNCPPPPKWEKIANRISI